MQLMYCIANISRQGHFEAIKQERILTEKEPFFVGMMEEIRADHPGMGLRKMHEQFAPEGMGRDAWISLGLSAGFRLNEVLNHQKTTIAIKHHKYSNLLVGKQFTDVNQIWVSDIFYFPLNGKHYYGILIMDVYSRKIIGYSIAENMRAENNVKALTMALLNRGITNYSYKLIHHSDRGSQYISNDYTNLLDDYKIQISVCADVLENAHCERVNGTIKNQYLKLWNIKTEQELYAYMDKAVNNYNNRKHDSLGTTPNNYEDQLKTIPENKRKKLSIFTINKNDLNPLQTELIFN
jgi:putative transposase